MNPQAFVGEIYIASKDLNLANQVMSQLNAWLAKEKWHPFVSLKLAVEKRVANKHKMEILLEPGEYQSNKRKKLRYPQIPQVEQVQAAIKKWLVEVE